MCVCRRVVILPTKERVVVRVARAANAVVLTITLMRCVYSPNVATIWDPVAVAARTNCSFHLHRFFNLNWLPQWRRTWSCARMEMSEI